jgi:hypothetical protein
MSDSLSISDIFLIVLHGSEGPLADIECCHRRHTSLDAAKLGAVLKTRAAPKLGQQWLEEFFEFARPAD